jgi:hypothetical protein
MLCLQIARVFIRDDIVGEDGVNVVLRPAQPALRTHNDNPDVDDPEHTQHPPISGLPSGQWFRRCYKNVRRHYRHHVTDDGVHILPIILSYDTTTLTSGGRGNRNATPVYVNFGNIGKPFHGNNPERSRMKFANQDSIMCAGFFPTLQVVCKFSNT